MTVEGERLELRNGLKRRIKRTQGSFEEREFFLLAPSNLYLKGLIAAQKDQGTQVTPQRLLRLE